MPSSWRDIRVVFLLQVAIVCLVVVLCMLGIEIVNGEPVQPVTVAAIGLSLVAIVAVTWLTYRTTRRVLAPMEWLLQEVSRWDPQRPDMRALAPERIPESVQGDTRKMADALHGLGQRMEAYIAREHDFTRDASHELRTPLTVIRVAADLIAHDPGLSDRSRRSLARIRGANAEMESLMDALLLLARDEDVAQETEDFAVRDVVEQEIERVRPLLEAKGLALDWQADADPQLHAPPRVLGVMLGSLLNNAVRFTDEGRIGVRLSADRVEVVDTGIGMDAAALARAFEPFYRANLEHPPGSGLGLSIAHRLGQRCRWPLQLASTPGEGTHAAILFGTGISRD
ncbi:HAMP domain-containing sensor histidine kinase [Thermomonas sp. HDW16]|uniref:sensor histidine kinase n=1 Tax=Thermomonas sp. HDW16 TaxID=2714945 RepID=UPI001408899E|nr:HAMP domain-containing sensor histidine kinase [Thermomonas sp. HDW16]QIL21350.1 HAMP domain-containing histidine kinase [Thermomonas sp. HDW16]